jgi:hypothetical protein
VFPFFEIFGKNDDTKTAKNCLLEPPFFVEIAHYGRELSQAGTILK